MTYDIWSEKLNGNAQPEWENGNILIKNTDSDGAYCYIFCSSNQIWFPNTKEAYTENLITRDRYEWTNFHIPQASKLIYLRDIYKSWYVTGINRELDSVDALAAYLRQETAGMKIVCVGSSSGGYLAILLGQLLGAEFVIAFSPQIKIDTPSNTKANAILRHYCEDDARSKYYDIKPMLEKSEIPIYYILPSACEADAWQAKHVEGVSCFRIFAFRADYHGVVLYKKILPYFITLTGTEMEMLWKKNQGRNLSKFGFCVSLAGFTRTMGAMLSDVKRKAKSVLKKIRKKP